MTAKISKIPSNYKAAEEFDTTVGKEEWKKLETQNLKGYIMTEQIKSIDFNTRKVKFVC